MSPIAMLVCTSVLVILLLLGWLLWPFLEDEPPSDDDYTGFP